MTSTWAGRVPDATDTVRCAKSRHELRWSAGVLSTATHDVEAELALTSLGGGAAGCIEVAAAWSRHTADERILVAGPRRIEDADRVSEHMLLEARGQLDHFPEVADDFEVALLLSLAPELQRRLVATVAASLIEEWPVHDLALEAALIGRARPVVQAVAGPTELAALPPTESPELDAQRVALPVTWLLDVWATDTPIVDGALVVDGEGTTWKPPS